MSDSETSRRNPAGRQCLDRRISDKRTLIEETGAWETDRNVGASRVNWQFTTGNARIKLKRLYPQIQA